MMWEYYCKTALLSKTLELCRFLFVVMRLLRFAAVLIRITTLVFVFSWFANLQDNAY